MAGRAQQGAFVKSVGVIVIYDKNSVDNVIMKRKKVR
jgi:hypothetical protein